MYGSTHEHGHPHTNMVTHTSHVHGSTPLFAHTQSASTLEPEDSRDASGAPYMIDQDDLFLGTADPLGEPFDFF